MDVGTKAHLAANKLAKWRTVFAGWQLGSRSDTDGEARAVRDHREITMMLRAELNGITRVLVDKEVISAEALTEIFADEYAHLDEEFEQRFTGFSTDQDGLHMSMPEAHETMKRLGFPD